MVDIEKIEQKLMELEDFFNKVLNNKCDINISSFGAGAEYGLKSVENMRSAFEKYKRVPQNKLLKQIHGSFTAINRGVEGFNDRKLDIEFNKVLNDVYQIIKNLEQNIKWR